MSNLERYKTDLNRLLDRGMRLQLGFIDKLGRLDEALKANKELATIKPLNFSQNYEGWYSEAIAIISQLMPSRLDDFIRLYKNDKRKGMDFITYTISDAILGVVTKRGGNVVVDDSAALPKFQQQISILNAAGRRFESSLFDIKMLVQADLLDSEIKAAEELLKKGFLRPAGVICGVIIEKHLGQVCINHKIAISKKYPTIADYNDVLKVNDVVDISLWRQIQRLADIRNLCSHHKDREPNKDEVDELISGTDKLIKSLY